MDSLNEIDSIFKKGEHEKELVISQDLKNRLHQEAVVPKTNYFSIYKYIGAIAATLIIGTMLFVFESSTNNYELEEFTYEPHPVINSNTIALLPSFVDKVYETGFLKG